MRIVYLTRVSLPNAYAHSVNIVRTSLGCQKEGHDVQLIFAGEKEGDCSMAIRKYYGLESLLSAHSVGRSTAYKLSRILTRRRLVRAVVQARPDMCLGRDADCLLAAANRGIGVVYDAHFTPEEMRPRMRRAFAKLLAHENLRALIFTSTSLQQRIQQLYPKCDVPMAVAPNGAVIQTETGVPREYVTGALRVGYIGSLFPGKGMEIISLLVPACPWAKFSIIGGMEAAVIEWRRKLEGNANVTFDGYVKPGEVAERLAKIDVVLVPFQRKVQVAGEKWEDGRWMTPIKLFEGMAAGKAVLVSDLDVPREIVTDGCDGFLCDPDDPRPWIEKLEQLRDDPELLRKIGRSAHEKAIAHFSWEARARNIINVTGTYG